MRFFGFTADRKRPSTSARPGAMVSTPCIHFGSAAPCRWRQPRSASAISTAPSTTLTVEVLSLAPESVAASAASVIR